MSEYNRFGLPESTAEEFSALGLAKMQENRELLRSNQKAKWSILKDMEFTTDDSGNAHCRPPRGGRLMITDKNATVLAWRRMDGDDSEPLEGAHRNDSWFS